MVFLALRIPICVSLWVLRATAIPGSPVTVAHENLITPAPVVYDVNELQRAWPTSDAVPVGGLCELFVYFALRGSVNLDIFVSLSRRWSAVLKLDWTKLRMVSAVAFGVISATKCQIFSPGKCVGNGGNY
jgi:hypothetical protein